MSRTPAPSRRFAVGFTAALLLAGLACTPWAFARWDVQTGQGSASCTTGCDNVQANSFLEASGKCRAFGEWHCNPNMGNILALFGDPAQQCVDAEEEIQVFALPDYECMEVCSNNIITYREWATYGTGESVAIANTDRHLCETPGSGGGGGED